MKNIKKFSILTLCDNCIKDKMQFCLNRLFKNNVFFGKIICDILGLCEGFIVYSFLKFQEEKFHGKFVVKTYL